MCRTPGCDNPIECPSFELCKNCYSSMLRWNKRPQKDQINRMKRLLLFSARMDSVLPSKAVIKRYKVPETHMKVLPGQFAPRKKKRRGSLK